MSFDSVFSWLLCIWVIEEVTAGFCQSGSDQNIARGKPTSMISTYMHHDKFPCNSSKAVDGSRNNSQKFTSNDCAVSENHVNAWWMVDLQAAYPIQRIFIKTFSQYGSHMKDLIIKVGMDTSTDVVCTEFAGPSIDNALLTLSCSEPVSGRYVKIVTKTYSYINLCEVEVYPENCASGFTRMAKHEEASGVVLTSVVARSVLACIYICQSRNCVDANMYPLSEGVRCDVMSQVIEKATTTADMYFYQRKPQ